MEEEEVTKKFRWDISFFKLVGIFGAEFPMSSYFLGVNRPAFQFVQGVIPGKGLDSRRTSVTFAWMPFSGFGAC